MTTMHTRSRLPRQDFLDTAAEVRHVEVEHDASEIDDDLRPAKGIVVWLMVCLAVWAAIVALSQRMVLR